MAIRLMGAPAHVQLSNCHVRCGNTLAVTLVRLAAYSHYPEPGSLPTQ